MIECLRHSNMEIQEQLRVSLIILYQSIRFKLREKKRRETRGVESKIARLNKAEKKSNKELTYKSKMDGRRIYINTINLWYICQFFIAIFFCFI